MAELPCILVIEDDPVFRRVLSYTISKAGFTVEVASDGERGFARMMQGGIDFLVTDYQMPVCSGLQLLERLDALDAYVRPHAILCTAKGLELDGESLKNRFGLTAILHKPFSPRKLTQIIEDTFSTADRVGEVASKTDASESMPGTDFSDHRQVQTSFPIATPAPVSPGK